MSKDEDTFKIAPPAPSAEGGAASAGEPWCEEVWIDGTPYDPGKPDPFDEARLPDDEGPPYPPGLSDPLSPHLIDAARYVLSFILSSFWYSPKWMAWLGCVWQWRKFDFLDWLRPVELLLRRLVMIEALSLLASQALPPRSFRPEGSKAGRRAAAEPAPPGRTPKPAPVFDPYSSETWNVSFSVIPRWPRPGRRRRCRPNPEIARFHAERDRLGFERISLRFRRVLHPMLPLAKRLEAVIRVATNPAPFARRAAFRLRARTSLSADLLLVDPPKPRRPLASDALRMARGRIRELYSPICEVYWSSA